MARRYETVTFLSDYGRTDEFVGVVHSVIASIAPAARVIDLTHDIAPYDVRAGGLLLARAAQYLCPGVVVAVVDPGVGGDRRSVAVEVGGGTSILIGPDNGLLAPAVAMCGGADRAVSLTNADYQLAAAGATFAGRDVFAPAAAHLCAGVPFEHLGDLIEPAGLLPGVLPVARVEQGRLEAEVLWVDRYGNAQLNVDPDELEPFGDPVELRFADSTQRIAHRVEHFGAVGVGEVGLVVDSYGLCAVALDRGSAAGELTLHAGAPVSIGSLDDAAAAPRGVTTAVQLSPRSPQ